MKVIGIVKNNHITGVEYGVVEIPDREISDIKGTIPQKKRKKNNSKKIKNNKKHNSVKNIRIKTASIEKETKSATPKKTKRRYRIHATITLSYNFKTSQKPVDLTKKNFKKKKDLFKKKQRKDKIALQNLAQQFINVAPLFDFVELAKQRNEKIALQNLAIQLTNMEPLFDFVELAKQRNR